MYLIIVIVINLITDYFKVHDCNNKEKIISSIYNIIILLRKILKSYGFFK